MSAESKRLEETRTQKIPWRKWGTVRDTGMWDEEDGFFYDVLKWPDGQATRLKVRSMVELLPLCAVRVFEGWYGDERQRFSWTGIGRREQEQHERKRALGFQIAFVDPDAIEGYASEI